jgi:hypothetical protein
VLADVQSVESAVYNRHTGFMQSQWHVVSKDFKSNGPRQLPWGIPESIWILLERLPIKQQPLCAVRRVTLYPQYSRGCKAITHTFFQQQTMIDNVKSRTEV